MEDTVKEVDFFNRYSRPYLDWYEEKSGRGFSFQIRREKVEQMIAGNNQGKTLLDIGAGPGIFVEPILRHGYKAVLADAAPDMLAEAKRLYGEKDVSYIESDARNLPSADKSYDVITAMGLVEYLEADDAYYQEMGRVLKDGGSLIVTYPNVCSPWRFWNRLVLSILTPLRKLIGKESTKDNKIRHKEYSVKEVKKAMKQNGFEVEEVLYYNLRLMPHPLDDFFPKFTYYSTKMLEKLDRSLLAWIGTAFIVKAKKVGNQTAS